jgi:selenocysteine-specific elongation factor
MIVGTAGHIDHGKTTLTRALTGIDTDRLKEEKERGISIELGYAYLDLTSHAHPDSDHVLGLIDVPGHERLVHTMASGASGIDYALLVVAADDGIMPQTREHLSILLLLGVTRGAVALTKVDRVTPERIAEVRAEIATLLAATSFADAALFETNATNPGDGGTQALLAYLMEAARHWKLRRDDGLFRLAVDRVFTLPGQGTVVTGTVHAGQVTVGDSVCAAPDLRQSGEIRIRGIHAQNRVALTGRAGQRCALNLAGVEKTAVQRGDWIVDPRLEMTTTRIDCDLTLLENTDVTLAHWTTLHVHVGSRHLVAHAVLLDEESLRPGSRGDVQLVFDTPVSAVPGDHLIIRNAQANRTIGGGRVLDPFAPARRRGSPARRAWRDALRVLIETGAVGPVLAQASDGLSGGMLTQLTGLPVTSIDWPASTVVLRSGLHQAGGGSDAQWCFDALMWQEVRARMEEVLARYHERVPDEQGVEVARLRRMVMPLAGDDLWRAVVGQCLDEGVIQRSGPWLHLSAHAVTLTPEETVLADQILPRIAEGGFNPSWVRDLAKALLAGEEPVRLVLRKLARSGEVFQVVRDLFYVKAQMTQLAGVVAAIAGNDMRGEVTAAMFRDATGLGRKRAVEVLEFFDRVGYTRRLGDRHLIRPDSRWADFVGESDQRGR